jgi:hypothetical protein
MSDKLIKIAAFNTPVEANFAQNLLAEEGGIESMLDNEVTLAMMNYLNVAVGGVKLFVYEFDAQRAREILARGLPEPSAEEKRDRQAYPGGKCSKCSVILEPGFEVCWSCGEMLEAQPIPAPGIEEAIASEPALPGKAVEIEKCPKCGEEYEPGFEACWSCGEPFDAPFLESVESEETSVPSSEPENNQVKPEASRLEIIQEADDLAKKAWFAAILGFFVCLPGLLHAYSAWLVFILPLFSKTHSR